MKRFVAAAAVVLVCGVMQAWAKQDCEPARCAAQAAIIAQCPSCDGAGNHGRFVSCVAQQVEGAWSFTPGMISEDVLRWIQASPWCAKIIDAANVEQERQRKAALAAEAEREQQQRALAEAAERSRARSEEIQRSLDKLPATLGKLLEGLQVSRSVSILSSRRPCGQPPCCLPSSSSDVSRLSTSIPRSVTPVTP